MPTIAKASKFKVKDTVRIIANTAGHNIKLGTAGIITSVSASNPDSNFTQYRLKGFGYNVYGQDLEYVSREDRLTAILENIKEVEAELVTLKDTATRLATYATDEEEEVVLIKAMLNRTGQTQDEAIIAALKYFKSN